MVVISLKLNANEPGLGLSTQAFRWAVNLTIVFALLFSGAGCTKWEADPATPTGFSQGDSVSPFGVGGTIEPCEPFLPSEANRQTCFENLRIADNFQIEDLDLDSNGFADSSCLSCHSGNSADGRLINWGVPKAQENDSRAWFDSIVASVERQGLTSIESYLVYKHFTLGTANHPDRPGSAQDLACWLCYSFSEQIIEPSTGTCELDPILYDDPLCDQCDGCGRARESVVDEL